MGTERAALIFTHVPWEQPGMIVEALQAHGVDIRTSTILDTTDRTELPSLEEIAAVIIMGGPMGACDFSRHPGLEIEAAIAREAIAAGIPTLGVCLGHQILATALGAALQSGVANEIGVAPIDILTFDPYLPVQGSSAQVLHWHGDVVDLPPGATPIASTAQTPNQAFRSGSAVGFQFHIEVDRPLLEAWLAEPKMVSGMSPEDIEKIRTDFAAHTATIEHFARPGLDAFASDAARCATR